ncbi:ABC transporter ATP-binding protein [uncultured Pseudosulfitobacter sp.]|jgi:capsular polysaccharide transport system ATP-binding protein|uniref:ABC transporter ATP-binding protein n=1 Tax=uncultured Pseudosulfitobacter sp. TaxID=2854214 RepID=UPI0030D8A016|tara:strand:- start:3238 stop:3906 length:669 start_codon:yes stop_codon:yes gene_type:complete
MIRFENLTKIYTLEGRRTVVADNLNATFPTGRAVALMGRNGAGKSSLLRMVAGTMDPTWGRIVSDGTISWPVGFAGSFHNELTGAQNVRFVARIYGVDTDELVDFVQDFAEVGQHFHMPIKSYSSGMKSRLTFGTSMGIAFDTYLIDEVTAVGDASFKAKSARLFADRMRNSGALMVSHSMGQVRQMCDAGAVLEDGKLIYYDDLDEAIEVHQANMAKPRRI